MPKTRPQSACKGESASTLPVDNEARIDPVKLGLWRTPRSIVRSPGFVGSACSIRASTPGPPGNGKTRSFNEPAAGGFPLIPLVPLTPFVPFVLVCGSPLVPEVPATPGTPGTGIENPTHSPTMTATSCPAARTNNAASVCPFAFTKLANCLRPFAANCSAYGSCSLPMRCAVTNGGSPGRETSRKLPMWQNSPWRWKSFGDPRCFCRAWAMRASNSTGLDPELIVHVRTTLRPSTPCRHRACNHCTSNHSVGQSGGSNVGSDVVHVDLAAGASASFANALSCRSRCASSEMEGLPRHMPPAMVGPCSLNADCHALRVSCQEVCNFEPASRSLTLSSWFSMLPRSSVVSSK
mmetsp:Transcript_10158/g.29619  ORF Transcript_10158/g.29619 Transcript_10158/m.29619 type:complete len:351 (+) Transcript_10158:398-1450(+)